MTDILRPGAEFTPDFHLPGSDSVGDETNRFMQRVYSWMTLALVISGGIAYYISTDLTLVMWVFEKWFFVPLMLVELALVIGLSWGIHKMNAITAIILFVLYSIITGLTLSVIFLVYQLGSIVSIFGVTAVIFAAMSLYGYTTKKDLTGIGTMALFGLLGIIVASLVNLWLKNSMADMIISIIGVVIFVALTAYDTQKIKNMNILGNEWTEEDTKEAVIGALTLYLDFINLFLKLLSLFGKRK